MCYTGRFLENDHKGKTKIKLEDGSYVWISSNRKVFIGGIYKGTVGEVFNKNYQEKIK